jgi:hypothetical protein
MGINLILNLFPFIFSCSKSILLYGLYLYTGNDKVKE